jgi:hypothetical protein
MKALQFRRSWKPRGKSPAAASLKQSLYPDAPTYHLILSKAIKTHRITTSELNTGKMKGGNA